MRVRCGTGPVRDHTDKYRPFLQICERMRVLADASGRFLMRSTNHRGGCIFPATIHQTEAQPCGVAGFASSTLSLIADLDTEPSEFESHTNRSRKRSSFSFNGSRVAIWLRTSIRAPSTPTRSEERRV